MKRTFTISGVFIILCTALALFFVKVEGLCIYSNEEFVTFLRLHEEDGFTISWVHSVEKESWEEMFVISEGEIELTSTRFKTFGAGVPNDAGDHTYIKDGWVYMTGISQKIGKELVIRTGESTHHKMIYGKDTILTFENQEAYRIEVEKVPLGQYLAINWRGEER